jgi:Glycosyl transferase family 11
MNKVATTIQGGLGNQMFQFAAGYSLAKRLNLPLALDLSFFAKQGADHVVPRPYLLDGYDITYENFVPPVRQQARPGILSRLKRYARRHFRNYLPEPKKAKNYFKEGPFYFNDEFNAISQGVWLNGLFHSELYFKDYADDIRRLFTYKKPLSALGAENLTKIKAQRVSVSLHVRRGDYVMLQSAKDKHGIISIDYYKRAVDLMQKIHGPDVHFFIFSDDTGFVEEEFISLSNKTILKGDVLYPLEDMYLMSQCRHHIIANSSFSWWGAWLNPHQYKTVIAPRWWFSREELKTTTIMDLLPDTWIAI